MADMSVVVVQTCARVGDIQANAEQVLAVANDLAKQSPLLAVFPEQMLMGAPSYDLLLRHSVQQKVEQALEFLTENLSIPVLLGYPKVEEGKCFNAVGLVMPEKGVVSEYSQKQFANLSDDQGFSRGAYFYAGEKGAVFELGGVRFGLVVADDIKNPSLLKAYQEQEVRCLIYLGNHCYAMGAENELTEKLQYIARTNAVDLVHCNMAGARESLIFQGVSQWIAPTGEVIRQALPFDFDTFWAYPTASDADDIERQRLEVEPEAMLYQALVTAVREYVELNGFNGALLGLSGGIDSGLTLAIAADALGPDKVRAVMMPFAYTSAMSKEDAAQQAKTLGVAYEEIPIRAPFDAFSELLASQFAGTEVDTTEENLQARCRGVILMALSNKYGQVVLACSNKSECAVGYSTLYGDMVGGFSVLKDVPKTWVYRLARWRNEQAEEPVIPWRVIERPPTAELAPGQLDENSLPSYEVLDDIVERYIEKHQDADEIIAAGLPSEDVEKVIKLIDRSEYKRQQGALGPKVTRRGFGSNRRYPVTYRW